MYIQHLERGFPFILIDDFYSSEELSLIWEELLFLCYPHKLQKATLDTGGAQSEDGVLFKRTRHVYLDEFYGKREYSNILNLSRKIFECSNDIFWNHPSWFYSNITFTRDNTQVSYYEDGDEYLPHQDSSMVTCLSWFYMEPQRFSGGDLFFPDYNITISLKNNRTIIFPSNIVHCVDKIRMDEKYKGKKSGRFCISQFLQNLM